MLFITLKKPGMDFKSEKDVQLMRLLPIEQKKRLLINSRKNDSNVDDKASNLANALCQAFRSSKSLKENLSKLQKAIQRVSMLIGKKPLSWLKEFNDSNGLQAVQEIITSYKTKYSLLYNNNSGMQYYNAGNHATNVYNNNEFRDKDTELNKNIRHECLKTLKSFANTNVRDFFPLFISLIFLN